MCIFQKFLGKLNPPLKVDSEKVQRWHPGFLDSVPDIEPADLPLPPEDPKELLTAKDVLNRTTGRLPKQVSSSSIFIPTSYSVC